MAMKALDGGMGGGAAPTLSNFSVAPTATATARFSPSISLRQDDTLKYAGKLLDTGLAIKNQLDDDEADDKAEKWMAYNSERLQKYQQLAGENALKDADGNDVFNNFYSDRNQYLGELTEGMNARQRLRFTKRVASSDRAFDRGMESHRFDSYKNVAFSRYDASQTEKAKLFYSAGQSSDWTGADSLYKEIKEETAEHMRKWYGYPEDVVNKLAAYSNSKMLSGLIDNAYNDGNTELGNKFIELYGGDLNAQDWSRLIGRAKEGAYAGIGRNLVDAISRGESTFTFDIPQMGVNDAGVGFSKGFIDEVANDKTPYSREAGKRSDCSSFVGKVVRSLGVTADTKKLFTGTSDSIIKGLGDKYGFITKGGKAPQNVSAGTVISIDTGDRGFDKSHWENIDHIAVVVEKDGKPFVAEKTGSGTKLTEYGKWSGRYKNARFFVVDASQAFGSTKKTETVDLSAFKGFNPKTATVADFNLFAETVPFFKTHPEAKKSFLSYGHVIGTVNQYNIQAEKDRKTEYWANREYNLRVKQHELSEMEYKARQAEKQFMPSETDNHEYNIMANLDTENKWHRAGWLFMDGFSGFKKDFINMRTGGRGNTLHDVMVNEYNRLHNPREFTSKIPPMNDTVKRAIYQELGVPYGKQLSEEQKTMFGDIAYRAVSYCMAHKTGDKTYTPDDMVKAVQASRSFF